MPPPDMVNFQPGPSSSFALTRLMTTFGANAYIADFAVVISDHVTGYDLPPLFVKYNALADRAAVADNRHELSALLLTPPGVAPATPAAAAASAAAAAPAPTPLAPARPLPL